MPVFRNLKIDKMRISNCLRCVVKLQNHSSNPNNILYIFQPADESTSKCIPSVSNESYDPLPASCAIRPAEPGYSDLSSFPKFDSAPEYVNDPSNSSSGNAAPTGFNNEEYMATDSGIGEDNLSLLSRGNSNYPRHCSTQSSNDSTERKSSTIDHQNPPKNDVNADVWLSNHNGGDDAICSRDTALDNPEYMLLNPDVKKSLNV